MTTPLNCSTEVILAASEITDWHLSLNKPLDSVVFPDMRTVPEILHGFAMGLAEEVKRVFNGHQDKTASLSVHFQGLIFRAHAINAKRFALRLTRNDVPILGKDVKLRRDIYDVVLSPELKRQGGLIMISGSPGAGKSWTLAAVVIARLKELGGYALSIEDPIEIEAMEGWHYGAKNKGYCEQMETPSIKDGGYATAIESSLRCFPAGERAMLCIGEVRDGKTAGEVLRIALAGHLVLITIHSMDHAAAMDRMVALAIHSGEAQAASMLAKTLRLSIHQRLDNGSLSATMLKSNQAVQSCIQKNEYGPLKTILEQQNQIIAPKAPQTSASVQQNFAARNTGNAATNDNDAPAFRG